MFRYIDIRTNPSYKYDQVLDDINYNFSIIGGNFTGGTVSGLTIFTDGLSATSISANTYYGLPIDVYVTGGTYSSGTTTLNRNDGQSVVITGYTTASVNPTTTYIPINSGGTFLDSFLHQDSNSIITSKIFKSNADSNSVLNLNTGISELTSQYGGLTSYNASTWIYHTSKLQFDALTYNFTNTTASRIAVFDGSSNLKPGSIDQTSIITGGTYSAGTTTLNKIGGGTVLITGYSTSNDSTFTGGTVSGLTTFTGGLSATSISATTYYGDGSNLTGIITNSSIARTFMFMGG